MSAPRGWWLVAAEVLAVIVLIALAAVAGQTAQKLSKDIDRQALADLARSDPQEVCVTGSETLTGWRKVPGQLELVPEFAWPNGTRARDLQHVCRARSLGDSKLGLFSGHNNSSLLDGVSLAAL